MSKQPLMTVSITFQTPYFETDKSPPAVHERELRSVPRRKAEEMVEDFVRYQEKKSTSTQEATQRQMYRYEKEGEELLVALDFDEVIALIASEDES